MAAMLNRMTPAVARTMEDLREGYIGIVPPMHIEKDKDKQAFTSPYRKPPIEKLAQDKVCAELLLLGFIEPAPSAQHAANPVVALKKGPDGQYTANGVCYNYKAINLLTKDMHTGFPIAEELFQDLGDSKWFTREQCSASSTRKVTNTTAEDNTGARIDLDSDLYAAFPTVPTTPYVPLDLTLWHIVDYILDVRSVLSICTTPLPAAVTYMAQNGITLYEMCGGMCAGLEAALRNGIQVNSPPLAPGRQLDTDLRLAAMSKDTDGLDIHSDQFVLEYLRRRVLGSNWTTSRTRRVLARSRKYRLGASPTGEERIIRILANGIERIVPAPSQRGNTMLMHAVEYFSAALVVVPIPAKEAIHTVYAHSHGVLAHFGAYALCISDNGPEFQGKFKEHLLHNFIDHRTIHPNHPQGNGFVKRSVGSIKAALTKICSENLATDTWDIDIAKVVTAYNCSPQETTKCAPFTLLYARAPVMNNPEAQLAMTAPLPDLTDSTQVQALTDTLLERAQWIKRVSPTIANHIAIAHHRDTLRYAKIRGGAYHPRLRKFQVGDFVYIRRPNVRNSLQMAAQGMILCIIDLKPTEVVVLQGRCVPVEDWFCPNCKASGITAIPAGRIPEAP
eukprot:gene13756-biopygen22865